MAKALRNGTSLPDQRPRQTAEAEHGSRAEEIDTVRISRRVWLTVMLFVANLNHNI